jgi:hypothetical protein
MVAATKIVAATKTVAENQPSTCQPATINQYRMGQWNLNSTETREYPWIWIG